MPPAPPSPLAACACVALGGAAGALARYGVALLTAAVRPSAAPLGTLAVNLTGCLLIGVCIPLAERDRLSPHARLLLVTGLLGALTTFSTFGYETFALADRRRVTLAVLNVAANLLGGLLAVWCGRSIATRLFDG